ncbi:LAFE_0E00320g1_1 [Lachancea fermentati]|uniref:LAFE_0E00320g1_1 n=1 Tax=Lachancea fermentati TaxID=4955 RepID=A0A1G4MCI2_LACFM|nr:LAFE_0E00320g1_1 [Lachancea fermentati]
MGSREKDNAKLDEVVSSRFFPEHSISLAELETICSRKVSTLTYPLASTFQENVPIYELASFSDCDQSIVSMLKDEWYHILSSGPGVFVVKAMYNTKAYEEVLKSTNLSFEKILEREKRHAKDSKGDHFAADGSNDRIWNSFSKHAFEDSNSFFEYYSNPWLAHVCDAWLGPGYQVTAQVNNVKPGSQPQECHRDYHLGIQSRSKCVRYPRGLQIASQYLTLQGAIAHTNMPLESGPTRFLPFSQTFERGYIAFQLEEFRNFFLHNYVALPLELGDGVFFNPALFHGAGANTTETFLRSANLLQISSAFGKPMETIDSLPIVERCWVLLKERYAKEGLSSRVSAFISAIFNGYPYPTNLDKRLPAPNSMMPESEQDIAVRALHDNWSTEKIMECLRQIKSDSKA